MPKNKGKGGKGKRKGKRNKGGDAEKAELRFKVFGEEYAQVRRVLGNCRVEAYCFDGKLRLCHVRGKFKKRVWINKDDFVLVGLRDYQDDKSDVIHKYTTEEARLLRSWGEIPADKANFDDDGAISGGEEEADVFEEEAQEGAEGAGATAGGDDSEDSDDELWQPNNNRNLPVGGEEEESSSSEESSEEDGEDMFAKSKGNGNANNKQSTQAILNSCRRNNSKGARGGRGGGRGGARQEADSKNADVEDMFGKSKGNEKKGSAPSHNRGGPTNNRGGPAANRNNPRGNSNARQQNGRQGSIEDEIEGL